MNPEEGSESPRSLRTYHKGGSGTLTGGGVQRIYSSKNPDLKVYKRKLDSRLGECLFVVFVTLATLLCIYGFVHGSVHDPIYAYVNRTHQIVYELENAINQNYLGLKNKDGQPENMTATSTTQSPDKDWLKANELQDYAHLLKKTRSTIWGLFVANLVLAFILLPVLCFMHMQLAEGVYVKIFYRVILVICLIFLVAQFLYMIWPLLVAAFTFPSRPCLEKMKNNLLPVYMVLLMMLIDIFPFLFAIFTYAWSACIKDKKHVQKARERVQLNNQRRVPIPNTQPRESYSPESPRGRLLISSPSV